MYIYYPPEFLVSVVLFNMLNFGVGHIGGYFDNLR
jgi:hypothetical protein